MSKYEKIIDIEYPFSLNRKRMPISERANIFSPFMALTGYIESLKEQEIEYINKPILTDESKYEINDILISLSKEKKIMVFTYFKTIKDDKGECIQIEGTLKNINEIEKEIILSDNTKIKIDDILSIKEK